jgi:tetraacyldisaccharide 4'-kinase
MNLLSPFALIYGVITGVRNELYDRGWIRSYSLGARTISVGNLTTGGTGKTPVVALVSEILANAGADVCILTRGYGRENPRQRVLVSDKQSVLADAQTAGDEPFELARKLIGRAIVIADADRVEAANWAKQNFGSSVFVLDDAFQHRRAKRDLDIVCIDATDPWGDGIIPAGRMRESRYGLRRADMILLTRADLVDSTESLEKEIRKYNLSAPIFKAVNKIRSVTSLENFNSGRTVDMRGGESPSAAYAFCALGNPENFRKQLAMEGVQIVEFRAFRDHHKYSQADIDEMETKAVAANARAFFTTAKDAVKLKGRDIRMPVFVVEIEVRISDRENFERSIASR